MKTKIYANEDYVVMKVHIMTNFLYLLLLLISNNSGDTFHQTTTRISTLSYILSLLFTSINPIWSTNSRGCGNRLGYKLIQGATCRTIIEH
jgi:hypothetical protein